MDKRLNIKQSMGLFVLDGIAKERVKEDLLWQGMNRIFVIAGFMVLTGD